MLKLFFAKKNCLRQTKIKMITNEPIL